MKTSIISGTPEEIAKKRAMEFFMLSPTEKFRVLMNLIEVSYMIREKSKLVKDKFKKDNK